MNLVQTFEKTAARMGERTAIVQANGARITFADLLERSRHLAGGFESRGLVAGDRVLLAMPVGIDLYATIAALWRLGAVVVFPEPAMGLRGIATAIAATKPKAFLSSGLYRGLPLLQPALWTVSKWLGLATGPALSNVLDVDGPHPGLISFTTGSTGTPKGIERSHAFLAAQNAAVAPLLHSGQPETDLVAFPVFVIANLALGITSVLPPWGAKAHRATPHALSQIIEKETITRALLPPSICETLVESENGPRLSALFTGGGPIFPDLMQRLKSNLPDTAVTCVYGSTEAEPISHLALADVTAADWERMLNGGGLLAGKPVNAVDLRIEGDEILVTGAHVNKTYLDPTGDRDNKRQIGQTIWHRTGDAGLLDDDGRLWLRGRHGSQAGGIYPFEIETAARLWPGVRHAALVANSNPPLLAIEGDATRLNEWRKRAGALGAVQICTVKSIPLDRRHHSKVDQKKLAQLLA